MKIETFKLNNQGLDNKTIYYVKFTEGDKTYMMNIGEKSYNTLTTMLTPKPAKHEKEGTK